MTTEIVMREPLVPEFAVTGDGIQRRIGELQAFVKQYMVEGEDFGIIPGTAKPTLYKPGAEKLCDVYGFQRLFEVTQRLEDWDRPLFHYEVRADLQDARSGLVVAQGLGSANSMEARYRWRNASRSCPDCGKEAIIKGKAEYGGGWICFGKKGGCGAKWADDDPNITDQEVGRIENDDIFTMVNTLLKMAKKRALVDAVLSATRSSGLFTQDVEDFEPAIASAESQKPTPAQKPVEPPIINGDSWAAKLRTFQKERDLKLPKILELLDVPERALMEPDKAFSAFVGTLRAQRNWTTEQAYQFIYLNLQETLRGTDAEQSEAPTPGTESNPEQAGTSAPSEAAAKTRSGRG